MCIIVKRLKESKTASKNFILTSWEIFDTPRQSFTSKSLICRFIKTSACNEQMSDDCWYFSLYNRRHCNFQVLLFAAGDLYMFSKFICNRQRSRPTFTNASFAKSEKKKIKRCSFERIIGPTVFHSSESYV